MRKSVYALMVLILTAAGCAPFRPVAYAYPKLGISLVCADEDSIDRMARLGGDLHDDKGKIYPSWYDWRDDKGRLHFETIKVPAFFDPSTRAIWMRWGEWCDTMAHELCHADGQDAAYCEDHYPRKG